MAILQETSLDIQGGFDKKIEQSALGLMMDVLQRFQYQFPIKSTIRELVSNGIDSVTEKNVAKQILSGQAQVSDYYENREGELFSDSKFDPSYYDPKYLSDNDKVRVTYHKGSSMEKDYVTVSDNGVGLGGYRLFKYFSLGYSTKRLSKLPLGKFGIGAKAPLSINPYYTIESNYNGLKFRFNIYNTKVESIIPKFNLKLNQENVPFESEVGIIYAEKTAEKNGVTITIEAKKHHYQEYCDAVERQLMYFDSVDFVVEEDGNTIHKNFKPTILYEDEFLIISDNRYFNRPHLLLNKVNYGFINFEELELEEMIGNVGIKVLPEDVEISPSRESLVWSEKTKEMVLKRFQDASHSAAQIIKSEMSETDFIKWLRVCNSIKNKWSSSGNLLSRLANIVDLTKVDITFQGDTSITYKSDMLKPFENREVQYKPIHKNNKSGKKIERVETDSTFLNEVVVLKSSRASNRKDKYLLSMHNKFTMLDVPEWMRLEELLIPDDASEDQISLLKLRHKKEEKIINLIKSSKEILIYEDIEVPEDFLASEEEEDLVDLENMSKEQLDMFALSNAERRKLLGKTVVHTPRLKDGHTWKEDRIFEWQKIEVSSSDIDSWSEEEIYYGSDVDSQTLEFVALLTRNNTHQDVIYPRDIPYVNNWSWACEGVNFKEFDIRATDAWRCPYFFKPHGIRLIKVAKDKVKLYQDFKHINKFFLRVNGNTITMSNKLVRWNTARLVKQQLNKLNFLLNFPMDIEQKEKYKTLTEYVKTNYVDMEINNNAIKNNTQAYTDMIAHLDKVQQFQMLVSSGATSDEIAVVAKEMWNSTSIQDGYAVELDILNLLNELLDWSTPVRDLLNSIEYLVGHDDYNGAYSPYNRGTVMHIPSEFREAILRFCQEKNVI